MSNVDSPISDTHPIGYIGTLYASLDKGIAFTIKLRTKGYTYSLHYLNLFKREEERSFKFLTTNLLKRKLNLFTKMN